MLVAIIKSSAGLQVGGTVRFTLPHRDPLKTNGRPSHKHAMRKHFHQQLRELYNHHLTALGKPNGNMVRRYAIQLAVNFEIF